MEVVRNPLHPRRKRGARGLEEEKIWADQIFQTSSVEKSNKKSVHDQKNERIGNTSLILLFSLGVAAGLLNGAILAANAAFCKIQAEIITMGGNYSVGLAYFLIIMCALVFCACCACKYGSRAAGGSGLPDTSIFRVQSRSTPRRWPATPPPR